MNKILILAMILVSSNPVHAEIYKWKDDNGKWHFTDDARKVPRKVPRKDPPPIQTPREQQPGKTNPEKQYPQSMNRAPKSSPNRGPKTQNMQNGMEKGFQELGEGIKQGLQKGMEKLGEEMGKAFSGLGELMIIAEENKPDTEKRVFDNEEKEAEYEVQQTLLGMFLFCQMQFIMKKSETCSKDMPKGKSKGEWKVKEDSEMKKRFESHIIEIDPKKNTRQNLLIKARQNNSENIWIITQEGKKSIQKLSSKKQ